MDQKSPSKVKNIAAQTLEDEASTPHIYRDCFQDIYAHKSNNPDTPGLLLLISLVSLLAIAEVSL